MTITVSMVLKVCMRRLSRITRRQLVIGIIVLLLLALLWHTSYEHKSQVPGAQPDRATGPQSTQLMEHVIETRPVDTNKKKSVEKIVYTKIGKTGSTTFIYVIIPYCFHHNLSMILQRVQGGLDTRELEPGLTWDIAPNRERPPAMIAAHARYNSLFFDKYFPDDQTTYIASIRDPVTWFISFVDSIYTVINSTQTPKMFLNQKDLFYARTATQQRDRNIHNYFLRYFGFDMGPTYRYDEKMVLEYIKLVDKKYDLIMLTEYTVESLILLKHLLNWSMKDIFYSHKNSASYSSHTVFTEAEKRKLLDKDHNRGDWLLYQHFNRTFWRKVSQYPDFSEEAETFIALNRQADIFCKNNMSFTGDTSATLHLSNKWEPDILVDYDICVRFTQDKFDKELLLYAPFYCPPFALGCHNANITEERSRSGQPWPGLI